MVVFNPGKDTQCGRRSRQYFPRRPRICPSRRRAGRR